MPRVTAAPRPVASCTGCASRVADLQGRTVLLVDDILDEGHTLKAVRDDCLRRGAKQRADREPVHQAPRPPGRGHGSDFNGVELPDRYVFGFGMDYYEQGRNLPGIYALR